MRKSSLLYAIMLFLCPLLSFAQKKTITGKITDATSGSPLENVSIKIKSTKSGVVTDKKGLFTINVSVNDVLVISYVGYTDQEVTVGNTDEINIVLQQSVTDLSQLVIVGSRTGGRIKTETPVPVDIVNMNQVALPTSRMDITSVLNYAAPCFNYNKQSGSDGADHIDLATLRGLSPDQTLVLINGKRRHQTAFVAVFGTRGRGASGTDLNAIPEGSIDHIEILRDGASAQYGSDAIAGVINIILKKDVRKFSMNVGYSGYYDHTYNTYFDRQSGQYPNQGPIDGNMINANANYGFNIGKNGGFLNL
jgi:iron complex outermembrane receptor protein